MTSKMSLLLCIHKTNQLIKCNTLGHVQLIPSMAGRAMHSFQGRWKNEIAF